MPIEYVERYTRFQIQAARKKIFVFGDNVQRRGYGGQAAVARGEPNTIGIATKWAPDMQESSFFSDENLAAWEYLNADLHLVEALLARGSHIIVVPRTGIGTGFAQLRLRAPRMLAAINNVLFPETHRGPRESDQAG